MQRILEPEVMDSPEEAAEYDRMDFLEVNTAFAQKAIAFTPTTAKVLDAGVGTARIPILIARERPQWSIIGIDLAQSMLDLGRKNVAAAELEGQITLEMVDSKHMPYGDGSFDLVLSNSLVHHLPNPLPFFCEVKRVLKPQGGLLIRDLLRPINEEAIDRAIAAIGSEYSPHQTQLFRDSLQAAFTLDEVRQLLQDAGLTGVKVYQSSDRHWTAEIG